MSPSINRVASDARPSPTMGAAASATSHEDPISLAVGEPSDAPPAEVAAAAERAIEEGRTRYGAVAGLRALRERLAAVHQERTGAPTTAENVVVTAGGKPALMDALRCILEPGDEMIVPLPAWPTFVDQPMWLGATAVTVPAEPDLLPDPDRIAAACTERTRAVLVNSPGNPTGRVWPKDRMEAVVALAKEKDLWILSDEVYRELSLVGPAPEPVSIDVDAADRTIVIDSFSKRFSMTGWRVGSVTAPAEVAAAMTNLMSTTVTHACAISQHAALAALDLDGTWEHTRLERHRRCRDQAKKALDAMDGVDLSGSDAGLYAFPDVSGWIADEGFADDAALCAHLRESQGLLLVPGTPFGAPGRFRLSWSIDETRLAEALSRLLQARA